MGERGGGGGGGEIDRQAETDGKTMRQTQRQIRYYILPVFV